MQRALLQYFNPKNQGLVIEALKKAGRLDLIGTSPGCLVRPDPKTAARVRNKKPAIKKHTVKKGKGALTQKGKNEYEIDDRDGQKASDGPGGQCCFL